MAGVKRITGGAPTGWPGHLAVAALVVALGLVGCSKSSSASSAKPIVLGVNDVFCAQTHSVCVAGTHLRQYVAVAQELRNRTGLDIRLHYYQSETLLIQAAGKRQIAGVICKAWPALQAAQQARTRLDRLADVSMPGGKAGLEGVFFTLADSPIRALADLTGKRVGLGMSDSYEKSYAARRKLAALGVKPGQVEQIGTCIEAAAAVRAGEVDAAVMSSYAFDFGSGLTTGLAETTQPAVGLRELGRTQSIPFVTVGLFDTLSSATREKAHRAMEAILAGPQPAGLNTSRLLPPQPWRPVELGEPGKG